MVLNSVQSQKVISLFTPSVEHSNNLSNKENKKV
jgi:hypothetical protein